jgi:hypothetical protein
MFEKLPEKGAKIVQYKWLSELLASFMIKFIPFIKKFIFKSSKKLNKEKNVFTIEKSWDDFTRIVNFWSPISDLLDDWHYIKRGDSAWFMGVKNNFGLLILFGNDDLKLSISFNW